MANTKNNTRASFSDADVDVTGTEVTSGTESDDTMAPNGPQHVNATESGNGTDALAVDNTDYVYVTMPDGQTRAVPRADVQAAQKRDADSYAAGVAVANEGPQEEFYVHLANGDVERVKSNDLPAYAGTNAANGYWDKDGHTHHIVGVYPVETENPKES